MSTLFETHPLPWTFKVVDYIGPVAAHEPIYAVFNANDKEILRPYGAEVQWLEFFCEMVNQFHGIDPTHIGDWVRKTSTLIAQYVIEIERQRMVIEALKQRSHFRVHEAVFNAGERYINSPVPEYSTRRNEFLKALNEYKDVFDPKPVRERHVLCPTV